MSNELPERVSAPRKLPLWFWIVGSVLIMGVVILGVLAILVVPNVLHKFSFAQIAKAKVDLARIDSALEQYGRANAGRYPESLVELVTPDTNGQAYLVGTKIPLDPWGREYVYAPPSAPGDRPIVRTLGKDGRSGGTGVDADLDSFSLRRK